MDMRVADELARDSSARPKIASKLGGDTRIRTDAGNISHSPRWRDYARGGDLRSEAGDAELSPPRGDSGAVRGGVVAVLSVPRPRGGRPSRSVDDSRGHRLRSGSTRH